MPNGDGGFDFGNSIPDISTDSNNALLLFLIAIINAIIAVLNFILALLNAVVRFLFKAFAILVRGFRHVISDIIHGRFLHLYQDYLRLKAKLREWVDKHLGWLLRLRKQFDDWFRHTIVPILNLIQRLRAILTVFRIFHLKFAERLDALLGRLEAKIIKNTLALRSKLNEVVSIIDLVLDPGLLIRQNVLLGSAVRAVRGLFNALGLGWGRKLTSAEEARERADRDRYTVVSTDAHADQLARIGPSVDDLLLREQVRDSLTAVTGLPRSTYP